MFTYLSPHLIGVCEVRVIVCCVSVCVCQMTMIIINAGIMTFRFVRKVAPVGLSKICVCSTNVFVPASTMYYTYTPVLHDKPATPPQWKIKMQNISSYHANTFSYTQAHTNVVLVHYTIFGIRLSVVCWNRVWNTLSTYICIWLNVEHCEQWVLLTKVKQRQDKKLNLNRT